MFTKKLLLPMFALAALSTTPVFAAADSDTTTTSTTSTSATTPSDTTATTGTNLDSTNAGSATSTSGNTSGTGTAGMTTSANSNDASQNSNSCGCGYKNRMEEMMQSLNLTDAQKTQIQGIHDRLKTSMKANWEQMKTIRDQMHSLITASTLDTAKLDTLVSQKTSILANMMKAKAMAKNQIYNILNADQKQQFQQMMQQKKCDQKS